MQNPVVTFVRNQFTDAHGWLEGVMENVTQELAEEKINPLAMTIGAQYLHIVTAVDILVLDNFGNRPMVMSGLNETDRGFSPLPDPKNPGNWEATATFNLEKTKNYCTQVFTAVDKYLAQVPDSELSVQVETTFMGTQPKSLYLNMALLNIVAHCGEISNMKGLKGLKGYPW